MANTAELDQHVTEIATIASSIQGAITTMSQALAVEPPNVYQLRTDLQAIAQQAARLQNLSPLSASE
jgi:hypothetical protein